MATTCPLCDGRGWIGFRRQRGGLLGKLLGPETRAEKCLKCNGVGIVQETQQAPEVASKPPPPVASKPPRDEQSVRFADQLRDQLKKQNRDDFVNNIKQHTATATGVDDLAAIFLETERFYGHYRDYMGETLARLGRKDVLFSAMRRSDAENGIGYRDNYWDEVLN